MKVTGGPAFLVAVAVTVTVTGVSRPPDVISGPPDVVSGPPDPVSGVLVAGDFVVMGFVVGGSCARRAEKSSGGQSDGGGYDAYSHQ
ncbi:hypothetical protein [Streptomyces halobius]|uniref:Secreted protein n=1 Tax=Streptomyces halobius TaxID=2879846 RepID=A0ABY4M4R2_9ACTN|nr:hypothetical protein [Streptomyces halobius]UQA92452.1 hypothetical protein K9S39_11935 [Streptomyces halobius]